MQIFKPCYKADLMQLSKLCRLERLRVDLPVVNAADHPVCFDLVAQLTALTALELTVGTSEGFSSIGNCSNLQELKVKDAAEVGFELSANDWEVVGQLTQLTYLMLWPVVQRTDCVPCRSALQQLPALQSLFANSWVPEVLPGLQGLSHLSRLGGGWLPGVGSAELVTCPQVQQLAYSYGEIPCSAFPGLLHISLYSWVPARVLAAFSKQCCLLQTIGIDNPSRPTLDFGEPVAERVAALVSLSSLQHLTALSFAVMDNAEMLAVSRVAAVLAKSHKLASVSLVVPVHSEVSISSLLHVAQLSGLNMLRVQLGPHFLDESDTLQSFVCALAVVQDVEVLVSTMHEFDTLSEAFAETSSIGLEVPLHYKVTLKAD